MPKWKRLAEHYEDNPNVVIAKMNAVANEVEETKTDKHPVLILFKRETNEMVTYRGKMTSKETLKSP